jgi:ADP-dependent NAD(P)H-hydrate dehydratase / NAD(P)H-hydrate epimerase
MPHRSEAAVQQILTTAQMRAAEQALIETGTSAAALMERAGRGAGEWVRRMAAGRSVTVLCGPGNNGGDGYVIARYLQERGGSVRVIAAGETASPVARAARARYAGEVLDGDASIRGDVLVDCLFGTGLKRPLAAAVLALLSGLARHHAMRVAVDVPSGIDSDSGACLNSGLPGYDLTLALGAWKHAHWTMPAAQHMGALRLVDLGVAALPGADTLLEKAEIAPPDATSHKYRRGLLAIVGGQMPGATLLAAEAAMRAGAGYVKLFVPARPEGVPAGLVCEASPVLSGLADRRIAAMLVGPGLGRDEKARARLSAVLECGVPVVLDADALMLLRPGLPRPSSCVLTPHEGELGALELAFGLSQAGLRRDRALALAEKAGAIVLLKGPDSLIAVPDGTVTMAPRASPWLSIAGSGDVLAGIIASRLAVHRDPLRAAREGLWLHGEAARQCGAAFTAYDLAAATTGAMRQALS